MPRRTFFTFLIAASAGTAPAALRPEIVAAEFPSLSSSIAFRSAAGVQLELVLDPQQAALNNPRAGDRFYPADAQLVRAAVEEMAPLPGADIAFTIYCLPGLPLDHRESFTIGREIFLIPALAVPSEAVLVYTVVHEVGHVLQNVRMPGRRGALWLEYLQLRGLRAGDRFRDAAMHRDRPAEIFAEDFRALVGGARANLSGTIENPDLVHPSRVPGLTELLLRIAETGLRTAEALAEAYPNPCNPRTTLRALLPELSLLPGALVRADIFDLRGRRLRQLAPQPVTAIVEFSFDGKDERGDRLASGRYYFRISAPGLLLSSSITLVQ